jgi:transposase
MARDLALDCHRKSCFLVAMDPEGNELLRRRYATHAAGEEALLAQFAPGDRVVIEATTGVFRLANRIESRGATVIVVDPQQSRLVGLRGKKTDYRDCLALLQMLRNDTYVAVWRPDAPTRQLRRLTRERHSYNQMLVRTKSRIRALLWEEGLPVVENLWTEAGQEWLAEQPLAADLRRTLARELEALRGMEVLKHQLDADLAQLALERPEVERLLQLAGFGTTTAAMFLGEVGSLQRFSTPRQLVSYAGLDPRVHQSGERCQGGRISKGGRSQLRWLMVEVAWAHVVANGPEAALYHRLVKRGKPKGVAITALARHLLVIAYRLLTRRENYRSLDAAQYELKLQRLAAHRPHTEEAQPTNVDWAAERLQQLTGMPSPYLAANPRSQLRRRALPRGAGTRPRTASRNGVAASGRAEFPAQGESDPSARPLAANLAAATSPPRPGVTPAGRAKTVQHAREMAKTA